MVRGVATAQASGFNSSFSAAGSAFKNLVVNGAQINNVNPNTTISLPAVQFGSGSFVKLLEEIGSASQPAAGQLTGGTFAAAVLAAVNHSGDSDSTGAITGNLLGAAGGRSAVPEGWVAAVSERAVVEQVAGDLSACFAPTSGSSP